MSIELAIGLYSGFHFPGELRLINRLCDGIHQGVIVSIGSFRGQADCALAMHAHVPVYCVDPRTPSDGYPFGDQDRVAWMQNVLVLGVADKVRPINLPSLTVAKIWQEPISFLWIDGDHQMVEDDLTAWLPHVMTGGLVATHDSNSPMVIAAVAKFAQGLKLVEHDDLTYVYRNYFKMDGGKLVVDEAGLETEVYERYEYNGVVLEVRRDVYGPADKHAVQEVQDYPLPDFPLKTIIDAGAMIGDFTVWIKQKYPDAAVIAIEPEPGNFSLLQRNVRGLSGITTCASPLGYDQNKTHLYVDPVNPGGHTLADPVAYASGNLIQMPTSQPLEFFVPGVFRQVDLLKMDVEGAEADVLLNAKAETLRHVRFVVGERHFTHEEFLPVINRLESLGFEVVDMPHPELSGAPYYMANRGIFTALNKTWNGTGEGRPKKS